jgi:hypothetical protein
MQSMKIMSKVNSVGKTGLKNVYANFKKTWSGKECVPTDTVGTRDMLARNLGNNYHGKHSISNC